MEFAIPRQYIAHREQLLRAEADQIRERQKFISDQLDRLSSHLGCEAIQSADLHAYLLEQQDILLAENEACQIALARINGASAELEMINQLRETQGTPPPIPQPQPVRVTAAQSVPVRDYLSPAELDGALLHQLGDEPARPPLDAPPLSQQLADLPPGLDLKYPVESRS